MNNIIKNISVLAIMFTMVAPLPAGAATVAELQAQIASLQAQLAQLMGQSQYSLCTGITFVRNLMFGISGSDVRCLQNILNASADTRLTISGPGSPGMETSFFGPLTRAAVTRFQQKYRAEILTPWGLVSGTGFVGTTTRAKLNSLLAVSPPPTTPPTIPPPTNLFGTASIDTITDLSQYSAEDVGEGESNVIVLGREIEMDNSGNARLQQVRVKFDHSAGTEESGSSTTFSKYAQEVTIWLNGNKVGSAMASDFSRDSSGVYTKTIIVNSSAILNSGADNTLTVAVTAIGNLDSSDQDEVWGVNIENIRYVDGTGAVVTDTSTGDLETQETFTFKSLASATDLELKLTPSNNPVAQTIEVSTTTDTSNITMLSFTVKAEGDKLWIDELPVVLTTTGGANISGVVAKITLKLGSETFTETLPTSGDNMDCDGATSCIVTFDDLDFWIEANQSVSASVTIDAQEIVAGTFDEGDSLIAAIRGDASLERDDMVVEDKNGDTLATGSRSGVVTGESQTFRSTGISVSNFSYTRTEGVTGAGNDGLEQTWKVKFTVMSFGDTAYIPRIVSRGTSTTAGLLYLVEDSSGNDTIPPTVTVAQGQLTSNDATLNSDSLFEVPDGSSRTFEATITVSTTTASRDEFQRIQLSVLQFDTSSTDTTPDSSHTFSPANKWETDSARVKDAA